MEPERPLNCFLSFGSASSHVAAQVVEMLQGMGVETNRSDLVPFQDISQILSGVRVADFICLIVAGTSPSPNVAFEAGLAIGLGKPVLVLATSSSIPFDFAKSVQVVRTSDSNIGEARRDVARFVRHVRPHAATTLVNKPIPSMEWAEAELTRIRRSKDLSGRETALIDLVARVFEYQGSEVLREEDGPSGRRVDLLVWSDPLVAQLGGPLIVECKYYGGGSGSVLVNARDAFKQLAGYVEQSSAQLGLLVYDHDRPVDVSLSREETPEVLAFFVDDLVAVVTSNEFGDEILRRRARAGRRRGFRADAG